MIAFQKTGEQFRHWAITKDDQFPFGTLKITIALICCCLLPVLFDPKPAPAAPLLSTDSNKSQDTSASNGLIPATTLESGLENSSLFQSGTRAQASNRLRLTTDLNLTSHPELRGRLIIDNLSQCSEQEPFTSTFSIHRAIIEYIQGDHHLLIGRQRIPLGVGRLWNPMDRFNPIDINSPEPEERQGSEALHYEYSLSKLALLDLVIAREQQLVRIKTFVHEVDLGVIGLTDNHAGEETLGWELAGALGDTRLEIRSEGGLSREREHGQWMNDWMIGGEYPLTETLSLLSEYHHDRLEHDALGWQLRLRPDAFWSVALLGIVGLNDGSLLLAPSLTWSLSDEQTLDLGIFWYRGNEDAMFGDQDSQLYLRWYIHF